ncbi:MAG: ATP phosphoribosyltransferase [Actinomycetaceae bacterium]|nr:ATP phosphoribosyltransferase [Actinomycetaceae bacterium]
MLRIAVPNKGSLSEPAIAMLTEAGYKARRRGRELVIRDESSGVEIFFLRPRDIAVYVGQGTIHLGITGRDLLLDSGAGAVECKSLGFARSRFRFAGSAGQFQDLSDIAGKRVATSYDRLVEDYLADHEVDAAVVHLDGAVESSIRLGVADVIADVVETGSTLRAAGLDVFGPTLLESEAVLICRPQMLEDERVDVVRRRLDGVMVARSYMVVDYNIHERDLEAALRITPGFDSPTISPLADTTWMAVRSMVKTEDVNNVMDQLHAEGARGIIVTALTASRL